MGRFLIRRPSRLLIVRPNLSPFVFGNAENITDRMQQTDNQPPVHLPDVVEILQQWPRYKLQQLPPQYGSSYRFAGARSGRRFQPHRGCLPRFATVVLLVQPRQKSLAHRSRRRITHK
jgi:hypothetical protein